MVLLTRNGTLNKTVSNDLNKNIHCDDRLPITQSGFAQHAC